MRKNISLFGLIIAMFIGIVDSTVINVTLPSIQHYFNTTLANVSWVSTSYLLALTVFMLIGSKLADQHGRKKLISLGLLLFGAFSFLCAIAQNLTLLIVFRFFQGIGGAIITPLILPIGVNLFGKERLPLIASIGGAVSALAAAGGPPIGGLILHYLNWRWIFGINLPFTGIALIIILLLVPESYDETASSKIDLGGMTSLAISMLLINFALLKSNDYSWHSPIIYGSLILGIVVLLIFILIEAHISYPMFDFYLLREKTFTTSCIVYGITGFSLVGPTLILNYYLQNLMAYTALKAALITMTVSLTVIIAMPLGTKLAGRFNASLVNTLGVILIVLSLLLLSLIRTKASNNQIILFLIVNGFGFGFTSQSLVSAVKYLPVAKNGLGSGMVNMARQFGTCIGVAVLMTCLSTNINTARTHIRHQIHHEILTSFSSPTIQKRLYKQTNQLLTKSNMTRINSTKNNQRKLFMADLQTAERPHTSLFLRLYNINNDITAQNSRLLIQLRQKNDIAAKPVQQIANAQHKLGQAITVTSQIVSLQKLATNMKKAAIRQIRQAFARVYLICALIVSLFIPVGLFTDKD
ncbi:MFS transporter [Ligilactobacillus sp. LYQ112]|uniref:MFS transporter n=1 Tax=Ligilactobacillus sp. LYQ112 TaxID=3391060 RepID=UPI0039835AE1